MLKKLQQRWKVNGIGLLLILFTFAIGGSVCGIAARKLLELVEINQTIVWITLYILLITLLWPCCVLLISIPLGQFVFFKTYLIRVWNNLSGNKKSAPRMAIFASGAGSNAQKIIDYFNLKPTSGKVELVVCNKPGAGVLDIAKQHNIETLLIEKDKFFNSDAYIKVLEQKGIQFIILAGFLWKVPASLIHSFPDRIINIHPALLPKYGGKGMYGNYVHEAVIAAGEKESGITIHYVDELYDHGNIVFQATCDVIPGETAATLAKKIHLLEHTHYPAVIEGVLKLQNRS